MVRPSTRSLSSAHQQKTDGYIVIIVLLLTAVLLTLGLSLATRTTEEVSQSGQEADATRVFNAAETGIEAALFAIQTNPDLVTTSAVPDDITDDIFKSSENANTFRTTTESNLKVTGEVATNFTMEVKEGEALTLAWTPGTTIKWIHGADCASAPAVIITLYNKIPTPEALHLAYNPYGADPGCTKGTGFTEASSADGGSQVSLIKDTFGLSSEPPTGSLLRIRPVYAGASFILTNSSATKLVSEASDNSGGGTSAETRKIEVIRTEPAAPSIFDYAVFSGGSLTKN